MEYVLIVFLGIILIVEYLLKRTIFTDVFWVVYPTGVIYILNNLLFYKFGYYKINCYLLLLFCIGVCFFYSGVLLNRYRIGESKIIRVCSAKFSFNEENLKVKYIYNFVLFVLIWRFGLLLRYIFKYGFFYLYEDDFMNMNMKGALAHLNVCLYFCVPILLYRGIKERNKKYIFLALCAVVSFFLTFIKYHVIVLSLCIFFYFGFKNTRMFKRCIFLLALFIIGAFVFNYYLGFIFQHWGANSLEFYLKHLWTYIAGGSINMNLLLKKNILFDKSDLLISMLLSLPNMFLNKLAGIKIMPRHELLSESFYYQISKAGDISNVTSTMGYIYGNGNIVMFLISYFIWGIISSYIYENIRKNEISCAWACCYFSFCVLSFFGLYFGMSIIWELLILSHVCLPLFRKGRKKLKYFRKEKYEIFSLTDHTQKSGQKYF